LLSEGFALLVRRGEPQANHFGLTGAYIDLVVRCHLGALLPWVHGGLFALHHAVVDAVLDVGAFVLLSEEPFVVRFVLGEEQRHIIRCPYRVLDTDFQPMVDGNAKPKSA
jgi:hypothetical protein